MAKRSPITIISKRSDAEEYIKCASNPFYFIIHYIKIIHPMRGVVNFALYPFQVYVLKYFLSKKYSIVLKPRQMGLSTLVCAYALWLFLFHSHKKILLVSIKATVAYALLRKIANMYINLPPFLKVGIINGDDIHKVGTATRIVGINGSEIEAVAATEDAGRSEALSLLIMDEVAFQKNAAGIWGAAQQTLATGGKGILLSTAYGVGNFFHESWAGAMQGLNGMYPVQLNWKMHPERNQAWYDEQRALLGEKRTAQEIDCDFLKSGYNVFDLAKIRAIEDRLLELSPRTSHNGMLKQYFDYDPRHQYVMGADIATGRSRDFSTFSLFDEKGKEYACFKGKLGTRDFSMVMMEWGKKYGWALLAPEVNAIGEAPVAMMQEYAYPNIYHAIHKTMKLDAFRKEESLIMGWITSGKTRHEIITGMDDDLMDDLVEINNPFFVQEAMTFIYNEGNKPIALGKEMNRGSKSAKMYENDTSVSYNDDAIFGACIGNEVRKNPARYRGNLPISVGA